MPNRINRMWEAEHIQTAYAKTIELGKKRPISVAGIMNATGEDLNVSRYVLNRMIREDLLTPRTAGYVLTPKALREVA